MRLCIKVPQAIEEAGEVFTSFWDTKAVKTIIAFAASGGGNMVKTNKIGKEAVSNAKQSI